MLLSSAMTFVVVAGCLGLAVLCLVTGCPLLGAVLGIIGVAVYIIYGRPSKIVDAKGKAVFVTGKI